jgi:hypothetical protein
MSSFTDNLIVSPLKDSKRWVVRKEFSYDVGFEGSNNTIVVPAGFITDYASIPQFLWSLFPNVGKYTSAAVIHDFLYYSHERTRKEADDIFKEGMIVLGVEEWKANLFYSAVRTFGEGAYKNNKKYIINFLDEYIKIQKMEKL